jgi:hypothetical protein
MFPWLSTSKKKSHPDLSTPATGPEWHQYSLAISKSNNCTRVLQNSNVVCLGEKTRCGFLKPGRSGGFFEKKPW